MTVERLAKKIQNKDYQGDSLLYTGNDSVRGRFYCYDDQKGVWEELPLIILKQHVLRHQFKTSPTGIRSVIEKLAILTYSKEGLNSHKHLVNLENGMFDFSTRELCEHKREYYSSIQLPFKFDADAKCPQWLSFLDTIFPKEEDKESIATIQEMFGYAFTPDASFHKAFILHGEGGTGKSTLANMLSKMLGEENYTTTALGEINKGSNIINMKDKLVNFADETARNLLLDDSLFKKIVAGGEVQGEAKYEAPIKFKPFIRMIILTNNLPATADTSSGMWRRLLVVAFNYVVPEKEKVRDFETTMFGEMSGIFNWALEGLSRLEKNNKFSESELMKKELVEYRLENNNPALFIEEEILPNTEYEKIAIASLYDKYVDWVKFSNLKAFSKGAFVKNVLSYYNIGHKRLTIARAVGSGGVRMLAFKRKGK